MLDAAFKVRTANFGTLLRMVLFVVVSVQLLSVGILAATMPDDWSAIAFDFSVDEDATMTNDEIVTMFIGQVLFLVLVLVMQAFATVACFPVARRRRWSFRAPVRTGGCRGGFAHNVLGLARTGGGSSAQFTRDEGGALTSRRTGSTRHPYLTPSSHPPTAFPNGETLER